MQEITTIGLDLAKSVFQVHAVGQDDKIVLQRQVRRAQMLEFFARLAPCLIGMEACAFPPDRFLALLTTLLGAGVGEGGLRGAADAAVLRQALCQARQDRCD